MVPSGAEDDSAMAARWIWSSCGYEKDWSGNGTALPMANKLDGI